MMESLLKRIENNRKAHSRWVALVLCLSMLVSLGTFAGFRQKAVAKTYTKEVLDCPYTHEGAEPVAHVHNDDCYDGEALVCALPEIEAHTHTEACFAEQRTLTCTLAENPGHQHGEGCYAAREENVCGLEENPGHVHNGTCFNDSGVLICTMAEGDGAHTHTADCFTTVYDLVCEIPEGEGAHTHTDECYSTERVMICDKQELPVHVHDAGCIRTEEITVGEPEKTAEPEEKTIPEMPVSDPNADLETASDWEQDFEDLELSGNWARDLILVAATQQGRGESPNNFEAILNDAGDAWVTHGYTRYGAWYGVPYAEEWSAMFVSFCLRYAGIPEENVPNNPTAAFMAESFQKGELFAGRDYVPAVGDLIFFDTVDDEITNIDHMGIVYHVDAEDGTINTVEGDRTNAVATFGYRMDDEQIVGYGILPQNPDYVPTEEENNNDELDNLIVTTEQITETTVPAVPMPAQSWERTAGGIKVSVEAPEGAFPENTRIAVTPVNGNSLKDTVSDAVSGEVLEVQAVDITFFDAEGHEIEPAVPIRVSMTPAATEHAEEKTSVVHVDVAQQTAELVEQAAGTEFDNSEVVFDADAFTIYAIVYTVDTYFRSWTGETFRVTMDFDENAGIPQNAELVVEEILEESADYSNLLSQAENALDGNKQISFVRFFDISIMADGKEVQPLAPVSMKIQLADLPEETTEADAQVIHFGDQPEVLTTEAAGANVSFEANGFSVYAVVYTVDFEYEVDGQVYQFSIPGGNIITLSDLVEVLGILGNTKFDTVAEFMTAVVNVEFSDPELVKVVCPEEDTTVGEIVRSLGVEPQLSATIGEEEALVLEDEIVHKNEWTLISIKPFNTDESLTITMKNGDVIHVKVTDASSVVPNDGIKSLLTDVTITGASQGANGYIFYPDQPYGISLSFKEVNKDNGQFPMDSSFTYQLPAGLVPSGESTSNYLEIELSGGDHSGEKVRLNYTIDSNGLITFNWDKTTNPEAYAQLADALYSQFKLNIQCTYTGDSGTLNFGNEITKEVEVRNNGKINTPGKNAKYNPVTNCVDYTVTVYSDGVTKNVVITDTVSGSALTYKNDAVAITTVNGKSIPQPSTLSGGNGFTMTVPQMNDGETITVKYSAEIDLSKVTKNTDGSWGTVDETGNKVVVKSKDNPDVEKENSGKDFEQQISMANIGKNGENVEADENGHATVNWTIHANDNANVSMGGHYIKDTIDNGSNMTYNSLGIHVVAYNADGSHNYETDILWGQNGLSKTADGKSWTWNIPNQDPDNQKLSYVITYTTDVDVRGSLINTQVKNKSESDLGGPSEGSANITPHGGALSAHKKVVKTDVTNKTVTWEINFDVPATGLDSAKIIDTMPAFWENGQVKYSDSYLGNSTITITPELAAGESYEATPSDDGRTLTIEFYKTTDDEQKVKGLSATGSARKIRVQFQTEFNEDWLTAAESHQNEDNYTNHTNTGRVILNGQTIGVSATTKVESNEPGMSKVHEAQTKFTANGDELPAFPYTIKLVGVNEDSFDDQGKLIIEDTFNSKYLTYYDNDEGNHNGQNENNGYVYGSIPGTNVNDRTTKGPKVVELDGTGKIKITIDRDTIPMKTEGLGESFYPFYLIHYYLTVKDPIALEKLEREIQNSESGSYPLLNTATNAVFGTTSTTVDFDIDVLDKQKGAAYNSNGNWLVDFTLNVNPDALPLGDEEELTLTDDYTNLSVDYTTIKIQKEVDGQLVDTTSADGVSWNRKGNRITYTLQNSVHYIITYTAKITGEPEGDGKVHFNNTAEYFGVKKWSNGDQNISSSGSGSSATYGIQLLKHEKGAGSSPLQGAKFKLYKFVATEEQDDGWKTQPSNAINTVTRTPEDSGWSLARTTELVTGSDGVAKTSSADHIQPMTWYMLIETEAPVYGEGSEHYQLKDFGYVFWITNSGAADYSHYVYLNDDVVAIDNEPPIPETVDIGVTKTWAGDTEDTSKRKDITVRLYADGVPYDDWTDKDGHHMPAREPNDTVKVLHLNADGSTDPYVWNDLPGGPVYSVREDGVAGYTTTYSPKGTQVSGTLGIRNKYIPGKTFIHVEKNWSGMTQDGQAEDITVHLKRKLSANVPVVIRGNDNGSLGGTVWNTSIAAGSGFSLTYSWNNNWGDKEISYYIYNRETGGVIKSGVHTFHGTGKATIEIAATEVPSGGIDIRLEPAYYNNWDQFCSNYSIVDFKENPGAGGGTYIDDVNFNNENRYYTISAANGWKIDIDRLVKEDDDGKYIYYIEEVGVNDNTETPEEAGYTVTYENNDGIVGGTGNAAQDTIKITNSPKPGSLEVTKTVSGTDAKGTYSIAVKGANGHYYGQGGADKGTEPFYVSFNKDDTKKWNNLPAGTYTVEEQDASVTGYTWHVTGTGNVEVPVGGTAEAEVTNAYEKLPETGSLKITKIAKIGTEEASKLTDTDSRKSLADGTYKFNVYTDSSATTLATKADGSAVGDVTVEIQNGEAVSAAEVGGLTGGKYYVKETSGTNDAVTLDTTVYEVTVVAGKTGNAVESSATATATNTLPVGSLSVTKTILRTGPGGGPGGGPENQFPPTGTFTYPVTISTVIGTETYFVQNEDGTLGKSAPETPLTVTAGATAGQPGSALTISNLPYGTYTVTEVSPENVDIPNFSYIIVSEGQSPSVYQGSSPVEETEGSVALRNYYMRGTSWTPEVTKLMNGEAYTDNASGYDGYTFVLSEDLKTNPGQNTIKGRPGQNDNHTLTAETNDQGFAVFDRIEFRRPDLEQSTSKDFYYTITEQRPTAAQEDPYIDTAENLKYDAKTIYVKVTVTREGQGHEEVMNVTHHYYSDDAYQNELTNFSPSFDNTELGTLTVQKTVQGSYSATDTDEFPFTVKMGEQYVTGTPSGTTYTYSGLSETDPGYKIKPGESNKITFINLPVGTYVVTEGDADRTGFNVTTTYKVSGSNAQDGTAEIQKGTETPIEITNSYSNVTLDIIKVEKNNTAKTLPGAKFMITLLDDEQTTAGRVTAKAADEKPVYQVESSATGSDGKVSFAGLTDGYYMIEETKTPDGYVISTVDPTFYIHVEGDTITYLVRSTASTDAEQKLNEWATSNIGSGLVIYNRDTKTATVQNEPGVALPSTGGIGTTLFTALGGLMTATAGAILTLRRKRKTA